MLQKRGSADVKSATLNRLGEVEKPCLELAIFDLRPQKNAVSCSNAVTNSSGPLFFKMPYFFPRLQTWQKEVGGSSKKIILGARYLS